MIPWSVTGAFIATTLQVPTGQFILYAPMVYLGIIFALIYIYTGFGIGKKNLHVNEKNTKQEVS